MYSCRAGSEKSMIEPLDALALLIPLKEKHAAADYAIRQKLDEINTLPMFDAVSQIVYAAARSQVTDVWVDGEALLVDGELTTMDSDAIAAHARAWTTRMGEPYLP